MPNGVTNVSYNMEKDPLVFEGEVSSGLPISGDSNISTFETSVRVDMSTSDANSFGLQTAYGHESMFESNYQEQSDTFSSKLIWKRNLGRKHFFELGPEGRYGSTLETTVEDGDSISEEYNDIVPGIFAKYRYKWLTLSFSEDLLLRSGSEDTSINSLKTKMRARFTLQLTISSGNFTGNFALTFNGGFYTGNPPLYDEK